MNKETIIGVDVGGTKIYASRYASNGATEAETTVKTQGELGAKQVVANLILAIETVLNKDVKAVGIAWAGFVDSKNGIIRAAPNIPGFDNYPLAEELHTSIDLPIFIENDARLFAYAEAIAGAGSDSKNVLGIILGTGVGSGLIVNGEIYRGASGLAGEVGHLYSSLEYDEPIEYFLSGKGLHRQFDEQGIIGGLNENVKFWIAKEGAVYDIYELWLQRLSHFTANLLFAFNPDAIVFGGGVGTHIVPTFLSRLSESVNELVTKRRCPLEVDLRIATLNNAGSLGAALYAGSKLPEL